MPYTDKPAEDPQIRGDPYKTLFVARLSYDVKEIDLEKEFGRYGPIERVSKIRCSTFTTKMLTPSQIRVIVDNSPNVKDDGTKKKKKKKPNQGYAFIVYEREKDMKGIPPLSTPHRIKVKGYLTDMKPVLLWT